MKFKIIIFALFLLTQGFRVFSGSLNDTVQDKTKEKIKTGWTFGAVPALAFDTDLGFKYGGVVNFYNFGNGSTYPKYLHSIYLEWSKTTKGSGTNLFTYDSEYLIPGVRISAEAGLYTEKALDFYGFNGYESYYNSDFEDKDNEDYLSRVYYRQDRKLVRLRADFSGKLAVKNIKWFAGFEYYNIKLDTVDITNLNKGKKEDTLPPVDGGLFGKYIEWGLLPEGQLDGGVANLFKLGVIYDTRDNEPNPMKGIWSEIQFLIAPSFLGNKDYHFTKLVLTHRQYFTLAPKILSLAYRVSYQAKISGEMPFYMLPFIFNSPPGLTRDGLGGSKTMRGILRNRIVGQDYLYGNIELRWKFFKRVILNQNVYVAFGGFVDWGMVTKKYKLSETASQEASDYLKMGGKEKLHFGYGPGMHFVLNDNFIVAFDLGLSDNPANGGNGFYMGLNFLF